MLEWEPIPTKKRISDLLEDAEDLYHNLITDQDTTVIKFPRMFDSGYLHKVSHLKAALSSNQFRAEYQTEYVK